MKSIKSNSKIKSLKHFLKNTKKNIKPEQCSFKDTDFLKIKKEMIPEKIAIIMVGTPGSGKTTVKKLIVKSIHKTMKDFINLDPDYIMSKILNYNTLLKNKNTKVNASSLCYHSSYVINDILYTMAQNQNYNIILDGTGKEYKWTSGQIENLYHLGYTIYICIVVVDTVDIAITRAIKRGKLTGRVVNNNKITKIDEQITTNIPLYINNKRAHNIIIYNNTNKPTQIYNKLKNKNIKNIKNN